MLLFEQELFGSGTGGFGASIGTLALNPKAIVLVVRSGKSLCDWLTQQT